SDDRAFRYPLRAATGPVMSSALADPQASFSHPSLKVVYFISTAFDYSEAIYPGIGPAFAEVFGWPVDTIDHIQTAECDVGIVDTAYGTAPDRAELAKLLSRPLPYPLFFRVTDPWREDQHAELPFSYADQLGVNFASTYQPAGAFRAFAASLQRSRVAHLPFAYDRRREIDVPM